MENSDAAGGSWAVVAKNASNSYPVLTTATAELEVSRAPADVSLGTYSSGGIGTLQYVFTTAEGITFWDKRGTATAYDITVTNTALDKNGGGDAIPGADITWTSTVADPPDDTKALKGSFASDRTGVSTASPCTLNLDCNAYTASTTEGKGGFFFSPTIDLGNLNSRSLGTYTGTITLTIV
jgi:hypothetical protein